MKTKTNLLFIIILALSPFIIYWLTILLPTFDDWTYFTRPDYYFGEHFYDRLMPHFSYWRPWDGMFGYILHLYPDLFPALNHAVVYIAHLGGTYIVYRISKELGFKPFACSVATLYFFISPAMLGTVLGIDSINQAYASFWGLLATYIYIRKRSSHKHCIMAFMHHNRFVCQRKCYCILCYTSDSCLCLQAHLLTTRHERHCNCDNHHFVLFCCPKTTYKRCGVYK